MSGFFFRVARRIDRFAGVSVEGAFLYSIQSGPELPGLPLPNGASIQVSDSPPFDEMKKFGWITAQNVELRAGRGDLCYLVYVDGALAHYSWVQFKGTMEIIGKTVTSDLKEGQFWVFDCCTAGWAKGRRIYPATISRIVSDYFAQGWSTALIATSERNLASQNGIRRAGFKQCATFKALRFGTHYFAMPLS